MWNCAAQKIWVSSVTCCVFCPTVRPQNIWKTKVCVTLSVPPNHLLGQTIDCCIIFYMYILCDVLVYLHDRPYHVFIIALGIHSPQCACKYKICFNNPKTSNINQLWQISLMMNKVDTETLLLKRMQSFGDTNKCFYWFVFTKCWLVLVYIK